MPPQQPYYQQPYPQYYYQPVYQPPAPAAPVSPYRQPVSLKYTRRMILGLVAFMMTGTLGMAGLAALAVGAKSLLSYKNLESHTSKHYSIEVPFGWQAGEKQEKAYYSQAEYYDGAADDDLIDRSASLQLSILRSDPLSSYHADSLKQQATDILNHRLEDYQKALGCKQVNQLEDNDLPVVTKLAKHETLRVCKVGKTTVNLYGQYSVTAAGDTIVEVLQTRPEIWKQHQAILMKSLNSVRVL